MDLMFTLVLVLVAAPRLALALALWVATLITIVIAIKVATAMVVGLLWLLGVLGPLLFLLGFVAGVAKLRCRYRLYKLYKLHCGPPVCSGPTLRERGKRRCQRGPAARKRAGCPLARAWTVVWNTPQPMPIPAALAEHCRMVLDRLVEGELGVLAAPFRTRADLARLLGVSQHDIKTLIGLDNIKAKLDAGAYRTVAEFAAEVRGTFAVCRAFPGATDARRMASRLEGEFVIMMAELPAAATTGRRA